MANENSRLVNSKDKANGEAYNVVDEHGDSFVNPRTNEHRCFVVFLIGMIVCLIALAAMVIFVDSPGQQETKDMTAATSRLDFLNSLYHERTSLKSGCESTVLVMRHCEKNPDRIVKRGHIGHCSWLGRERAFFLPTLFDPDNPQRRWPAPTNVFALTQDRDGDDNGGHANYRETETLMPLANKFNLDIQVYPFDGENLAADYFELLQSGDMCGKVTVVSWKHDIIPDLLVALACGPSDGCPSDYPDDTFDMLIQLKFVYDPHGRAKDPKTDPMELPVETQGPLSLYEPSNADLPVNAVDDDDDDNVSTTPPTRRLKRKKHKGGEKRKKWVVYGTKTFQYFDPLQFSMQVGDYPSGGSPSGGKWADEI